MAVLKAKPNNIVPLQTSSAGLSSSRTLKCQLWPPPSKCPRMASSSWLQVSGAQCHETVLHPHMWSSEWQLVAERKANCFTVFSYLLFIFKALTNPGSAATTPTSCPWSLSAVWILTVSRQTARHWLFLPLNVRNNHCLFSQSCGFWHLVWRLLQGRSGILLPQKHTLTWNLYNMVHSAILQALGFWLVCLKMIE